MADDPKFGFGIVIRPDGTIPFDPPVYDDAGNHVGGVHPDHKRQMLGYLVEQGNSIEHHRETGHAKILSGPHHPANTGGHHRP